MSWVRLAILLLRITNAIMRRMERRRIERDLLHRLEIERRELGRRLIAIRQRVEHMDDEAVDKALETDYRD